MHTKELNVQVNMLKKKGDNCISAGERVGRWNKNMGKQPLMTGLVCGHQAGTYDNSG